MIPLARFVIRPSTDSRGDLLLGAMLQVQAPELLRPNVVYEIQAILGELYIKPVGDAAIGLNRATSMIDTSWGDEVNNVIMRHPGRFLLTRDEELSRREAEDRQVQPSTRSNEK